MERVCDTMTLTTDDFIKRELTKWRRMEEKFIRGVDGGDVQPVITCTEKAPLNWRDDKDVFIYVMMYLLHDMNRMYC